MTLPKGISIRGNKYRVQCNQVDKPRFAQNYDTLNEATRVYVAVKTQFINENSEKQLAALNELID